MATWRCFSPRSIDRKKPSSTTNGRSPSSRMTSVHCRLGLPLQAENRCESAVAEFERALALAPNAADIHVDLGTALHALRRLQDEVTHYQRAVATTPQNAAAHTNLGNALSALDHHQEAIAHHRRALAINPAAIPPRCRSSRAPEARTASVSRRRFARCRRTRCAGLNRLTWEALRAVAASAQRIVDKMPSHLRLAGLLHLALPRAHHSCPPGSGRYLLLLLFVVVCWRAAPHL
jgi:tetratricopeptide (TPR) repeat protein